MLGRDRQADCWASCLSLVEGVLAGALVCCCGRLSPLRLPRESWRHGSEQLICCVDEDFAYSLSDSCRQRTGSCHAVELESVNVAGQSEGVQT